MKIIAILKAKNKFFAFHMLCLIMTNSISVQSQSWTPTTNKHLSFQRNTGNSLTLDISAIQNGVYYVVSPTSSTLIIKQ